MSILKAICWKGQNVHFCQKRKFDEPVDFMIREIVTWYLGGMYPAIISMYTPKSINVQLITNELWAHPFYFFTFSDIAKIGIFVNGKSSPRLTNHSTVLSFTISKIYHAGYQELVSDSSCHFISRIHNALDMARNEKWQNWIFHKSDISQVMIYTSIPAKPHFQ